MDDELELEVSDLRTGRVIPAAMGSAGVEAEAAADGVGEVEWAQRSLVRAAAAGRSSRRVRGMFVVGLAVAMGLAVLLSLPGMREGVRGALFGPTPTATATLAPGEQVVAFTDGVPWGTLTLDGRALPVAEGIPTQLPRGRHALEYRAAPFPSLRCTVSVPAADGDTCPVNRNVGFDNGAGAERVLDLGMTPERLPSDQYAALVRVAAQAVQAYTVSATVEPGDHYLGADAKPTVAAAALAATLTLALNTNPAPNRPLNSPILQGCTVLCSQEQLGVGAAPGGPWHLAAHIIASWQFVTPDGQTLRAHGPWNAVDALLALGVQWSGQWSVQVQTAPYDDSLCQAGMQMMVSPGDVSRGMGLSVNQGVSSNEAEGCAESVTPLAPGGPSATPGATPVGDAAIFIYHFGVVLAASGAAHRALPFLALASAHERALARRWLTAA